MDWKESLNRLAAHAEKHMDDLRYRLHYQLGGPGPIKIVPYRGYGTQQQFYLRGRVIEDKHIPESERDDNLWRNLLNMYRRMESDEVPHARLAVRFQDAQQEVTADEEGFFEIKLQPTRPLAERRLWHPVEIELLDPIPEAQRRYPVKAIGEVLVPPPDARFGVISDIDDTVIRSDATHLLRMARTVFLGNAYTRLPFPGVGALYRALFSGATGVEYNPLFYVSSSPWNLYDLLVQFFNLQSIPVGPVLFLRDWGLTENEFLPVHNRAYKLGVIRQILDSLPHLPFILIGDSGQEDPEIYTEIVESYPQRIPAVYIRNVSTDLKRPEAIRALAEKVVSAGSTLILADDSLTIAQNAIEKGFIASNALAAIEEEKEKDLQPATPVEEILQEEPPPTTPTVEVSRDAVKPEEIDRKLQEKGASAPDQSPRPD